MASFVRRFVWLAAGLVMLMGVATAGGGLYVQRQLQHSLPLTSGDATVTGLSAPVIVDRDALGVPKITAASRADAARALGFVHAQDRFFQMDLQRRQPAGELSALVGARALEADRTARVHRFRHISQQAIAQAAPEYRVILEAYAQGVNAGLAALAAAPIEYHVLRAVPEPWKPEDSILTVLAMFNTLQGRQAQFEMTFGALHDIMPPAMYDFLTARGSEWDAPVTGGRFLRPPVPTADVFDLRRELQKGTTSSTASPPLDGSPAHDRAVAIAAPWLALSADEAAGLGSNNWAVAGSHTASGAALVANDMHLAIGVPNIWYRATMIVPDTREAGQTLQLGASRCRDCRAWLWAATVTSPGASPIPAATGATWSSSSPILVRQTIT